MSANVRVYVVTYHRPYLLERALRSLLAQTHTDWVAEVLNDDPNDARVTALITRLGDTRIQLSQPPQRRGGTGNFNYAFRTIAEPFCSILEDDNWWEPSFLATMLATLNRYPGVVLACGNERIWREQPDSTWTDTGITIWPAAGGERLFEWSALDKCGSARLCNSSLLFRSAGAEGWRTPSGIPVDVTEHFRERVVPHPLLLVLTPLVNYSETLITHRSRDRGVWGRYQLLLVGSVFALAQPACRAGLARALWKRARERQPLFATTLLATGRFVPEARELWHQGLLSEKLRFLAGALRRPRTTLSLRSVRSEHRSEWIWLLRGPFADFMAQDLTHAKD
jgi:glycosyltransferase involved in cell wall biosynthesis